MNSLNLRQIDGGNVIKQADFGSNLSFELLDERRNKIPELDGQTATIRLIKGDNIAYQTESQVVDGTVSFKFDRVLEKGIYVLEIVADNYVFPSNNMVKITIEKTAGNYKPENVVKTDLVELQGKITAIEQREHDVNQELLDVGQKQAEMTKRIETLEQREDKDTIYNDTEIKNRLVALEQKEDKDTVYNDTEIKEEVKNAKSKLDELSKKVTSLESRTDNDTVYDDTGVKQSISSVDTKVEKLSAKVTELEQRPSSEAYDDTELSNRVTALERKQDNDTIYDDTPIIKRIEKLESKEDSDTIYDDSELVSRVTALENKPDKDTIYNDAQLKEEISKTKSKVDSLSEKVSSLESKQDNDTIYDDSEIKRRITALEQKEDHDTIYNDTEIKQSIANVDNKVSGLSEKVTTLEERPIVDTALTKRVEALERKEDRDTVYDDTDIKERISALEDKPDNDTIYDDSNLKAQVSELQEKLKSLNTVRRAPTGYTLDRTTVPWTVWFDNGCGMTMPQYGTMASIYGYGQEQNAYNKNLTPFPLPPIIMSVSHGTLTVEKIKTIEGYGDYWSPSITIINPVRDRDDYDWANARFNKASLEYAGDPYYSYRYVRQQYFIRTMYELGIWSGEIVEEFGAAKK